MAPENDIDYSLSRVPDEAKQPFWRILFIRIGAICCVSQLMLGAALGYGLTFWDAFLATMLGSVLLQVVSWALGTAAAREGLSTSLLSRWTGFGKVGSALFGGVVAISMVGWFGVQNAVFGQGMAEIVPFTDFLGTQEILPGIMAGITPEYIFWAIITGLGITLLVVFGIKAIANFATVFVPLFVIVVIVAAAIILAGGFIAGAICTPDYARFLKNGTQVFWMTLIGTFVGELGMNLLAVLLAHAMGTENIVDIMMGTSGIIGVIIVVASTVKLNDINLYSSSLGLATMINALFNKAISRNGLVWALGIVGTLLSVIGIINYFTNFLTLLGVAIPPVAGIMVVDYFILKRSRATLDASRAKGELPEKVEKWNPIAIVCWIAGFAVGEVTSIMNAGIPGLNSLILAGVLYWIVMKVYASMKKVDTVTFTETDQVL